MVSNINIDVIIKKIKKHVLSDITNMKKKHFKTFPALDIVKIDWAK